MKLAVLTSLAAFVPTRGGRLVLRGGHNGTNGVDHSSLLAVGSGRDGQPVIGPFLDAFASAPQDYGPGTVFQGGPMAQEPQWFDSRGGGTEIAAAASGDCHPKCTWTCGHPTCNEECEPICAPPQCETACSPVNLAQCMQKCDPPKCAVVCPAHHCSTGSCPACKAVCAPPECKTECGPSSCQSKCSDPQCTWKCKPGKCEKPKCSMTCGNAKMCNFDGDLNARPPPFAPGMFVLNRGLAGLDPSKLIKPGPPESPAAMGPGPGPAPAPAPASGAASPAPAAASPAPAAASPAPAGL